MPTTSDPTYEALLLAVLEAPADDAPRLILADWLGEQGESERSEFIRVQLELARMGDDGLPVAHDADGRCRCHLCALRRRERELFPTAADAYWNWLGGRDWPLSHFDAALPNWRRGFLATVSCCLTDWLTHGPDVVRRHPVERVVVTDARRYVEFVGREPGFNGWRDGGLSPIRVPGHYATPEDFASALGEQALTHARRAAFPCRACGGKGRRITIFPMGAPPRECSACGGRGWKVGVTAPTG